MPFSASERHLRLQERLGKGGRRFGPALVKGYPSAWQGAVASNITSHPQAGIGAWTDLEIKRALTQGIARDGRELKTPMKDHALISAT